MKKAPENPVADRLDALFQSAAKTGRVLPRRKDLDSRADLAWARKNLSAADYRGKWVALLKGALLATSASPETLRTLVSSDGHNLSDVTFFRAAD